MSKHSRQCIESFPGCLCLKCARDGMLVHDGDKPCCVGKRCGTFEECPEFEPEEEGGGDDA